MANYSGAYPETLWSEEIIPQDLILNADPVSIEVLGSPGTTFIEAILDASPVEIEVSTSEATVSTLPPVGILLDASPVKIEVSTSEATVSTLSPVGLLLNASPVEIEVSTSEATVSPIIPASTNPISITVEPSEATLTVVEPTPVILTAEPISVYVSTSISTSYLGLFIEASNVETPPIQTRAVAYGLVDTPIEFPPGGLIDPFTRSFLLTAVEEGS
jgi:hypothetical protein